MPHTASLLDESRARIADPPVDDGLTLVDLSDVAFALVGNTAVLSGTVASEADRRTVLHALELVPGIDAILDLLRVRA